MTRRVLLLVALSALPFSAAVTTWGKDNKADNCCVRCTDCRKACLECVMSCLDEEGRKPCIQACLDCADICEACAKIDARQGPARKIIAEACAAACENCAKECEKHTDDACLACAKQCRACAKECRG
ncbi:MAG TPA: four-helix bundle copper-binding protein [Pirellulales bacterium]|nr:four-helix bundle copper-binding protein [Pirellulales bacterium]